MKKRSLSVLLAVIFFVTLFALPTGAASYVGTVLDFFAEWCGPCKPMDQALNQMKPTYGSVIKFQKIDIDDPSQAVQDLVAQYSVDAIPRVIVLDSAGTVVEDVLGYSEENVAAIEAALQGLAQPIDHPPVVQIVSPPSNYQTENNSIPLRGLVEDEVDGITSIQVILNGTRVSGPPSKRGSFEITVGPLQDGTNTIEVIAIDQAGNTGQDSVTIVYEQLITFQDIPSSFWAKDQITELVRLGIIDGFEDGTFRPYDPVTREQFSKILLLALDMGAERPSSPSFLDVPTSKWSFSFVEGAKLGNLMIGFADGTFRPEEYLTNAQILTVICRQKGWKWSSPEQPSFSDLAKNHWAYPYIETVKSRRFDYSCLSEDTRISPEQNTDRAQVSYLVYRMLQ